MHKAHLFITGIAVGLLAGCAGTPPLHQAQANLPLRIDGRTPQAILSPAEVKRIGKQIPAVYRGKVLATESAGMVLHQHEVLANQAGKLVTTQLDSAFTRRVVGWLTTRVSGGLHVLFMVRKPHGTGIGADVSANEQSGRVHLERISPPRAPSPREANLWHARELAYSAPIKPCAKRYNPVVVPIRAGKATQIYVYLIPASADPRRLYLGGYYRITMNSKGTRILNTHAFTANCLALERRTHTVGVSVSEHSSDIPTVPQVYASLRYHLPIYVTTSGNRRTWKISEGRISLVNQSQAH